MSIARTAHELEYFLALANCELRPSWIAVDPNVQFMSQIPVWIGTQARYQTVRVLFSSSLFFSLQARLKPHHRVVVSESEHDIDPHNDDVVIRITDVLYTEFMHTIADIPFECPNLPGEYHIWIDKPRAVREARACYERELDAHLPPDLARMVVDEYLLGYVAHPFEPES